MARSTRDTWTRPLAALALAAWCAACGSDSAARSIVDNDVVAAVRVNPASASLAVGGTVQLTATPVDASGNVVSGRSVSFSSSNTAVATVTQGGLVTALAAGSAQVSATADGRVGTAAISVAAAGNGAVASVALTPANASVAVGTSLQLSAEARDAQGHALAGKAITFATSDASIASVTQTGLVTGVAVGAATLSATADGISGSTTVTVVATAAGNVVDVSQGTTYQTMVGWEASASIGEVECDQTAVANYQNTVLDQAAYDLGINRVRLPLRSGYENDTDYFALFRSGAIDYATWKLHHFLAVNDNADPNVADTSHFKWSWPDYQIDVVINPLRQRLATRGEHLYVVVTFIDFLSGVPKQFVHLSNAQEYAEYMAQAFLHFQQKYGWVPDAVEILLEPDGGGGNGSPGNMARGLVATAARLASLGFTPDFIAPSDAAMANSVKTYDQMITVPGVFPYLKELSYHRYNAVSTATVQAIASRGTRDGIRTSMLEHLTANIDELMEDLTVGNVSAWQQFSIAYCGKHTAPGAHGVYFNVNQSNPSAPIVTITNDARDFRQIFAYVRSGAVRVGATSGNPSLIAPVAFRNTSGKFVLAVRATGAASFTVRGMPAGVYGISYNTLAQTAALPDATLAAGGTATLSIPAAGVITLYGR